MPLERLQLVVKGQVQGVGFRPHVYRIATKLGLTGWVRNDSSGVTIEIQGQLAPQFLPLMTEHLPPLVRVMNIQHTSLPYQQDDLCFHILESPPGKALTLISPDMCICAECLTELFDPESRYYLYPFLNCTNCGPRLTITHQLPYDRCNTVMNRFPLCFVCEQVYLDPSNRRYHAQPTACQHCGPTLSLSIENIVDRLRQGEIIALKGLGGYQLICDARNQVAIANLRMRKQREAKPFALMVLNCASAQSIVEVNALAESLLTCPERPVLLLSRKKNDLPVCIAEGLSDFGVMLPSTPVHYLLFHGLAGFPLGFDWLNAASSTVLIVTSANSGGSPLVIDDQDARQSLHGIADTIVTYDREIVVRADDSVIRLVNGAPVLIRRARGYVPTSIQLPYEIPPTLALGGHLKNTFCITRGDEAFVSQHIGSLNNQDTIHFFHETLDHLLTFLHVTPELIAHDMHPDFYTTQFAEHYDIPIYAIQHHYAHLASVVAEHHLQRPVLGLVLDGYGFGVDGALWGGELIRLENFHFQHMGSFYPLQQPGGEMAAREPWRMAAAVLYRLGRGNEIKSRFSSFHQAEFLHQLLEKNIQCPLTSSCGRLFDAVSALLGVCTRSQYEGQAAMQLESLVTVPFSMPLGWRIVDHYFDMTPTLEALCDIHDPVEGTNLFHGTLIDGLAVWIKGYVRATGITAVVLSGGCFINKILTEGLLNALSHSGIQIYLPRRLPPNDGGLCLGQAWVAGNCC